MSCGYVDKQPWGSITLTRPVAGLYFIFENLDGHIRCIATSSSELKICMVRYDITLESILNEFHFKKIL